MSNTEEYAPSLSSIFAIFAISDPTHGLSVPTRQRLAKEALDTVILAAKAEGWDEAILRFEDALGYETRQVAMRDNPYRAAIEQSEAV